MIISSGVNTYPQEIENQLIQHPEVADVAVFGIPNEEFGEEVKAVVQPNNWPIKEEDMALSLKEWLRSYISNVKIPRSIDFEETLPRLDNGKLYKRYLSNDTKSNHQHIYQLPHL